MMKVLIDTNVLISAALSSSGTPYKAFVKAVTLPNQGVISEQNVDEMRRIFNKKFPDKIKALDTFLAFSMMTLQVVPIPETIYESEEKVRDKDDRYILRAALYANVDVIVTGDKDLLEAELDRPEVMTPAQFIETC